MATLVTSVASCNSKTSEEETQIAVTPALVAVKNFSLKKNSDVLANLDKVFFSIDLETGVIFNADSLPKDTKITSLVPEITFANTMTKANLIITDASGNESKVDYLAEPEKNIDFTNPVLLDVTAADGITSFTYQIRINVHLQNPDSIVWNRIESASLPSRYPGTIPLAQKTISTDETVYSLIEEYNGEFSLASCSDLNNADWDIRALNPGFRMDVENFISGDNDRFYILDNFGNLYFTEDFNNWTSTGETWVNIIGNFGEMILGVRESDGQYIHSYYPEKSGYTGEAVAPGFPVFKSSPMALLETQWASSPMGFIAGGITDQGSLCSDVWAFDGEKWAVINEGVLPALESPMLARYYIFRNTNSAFVKKEFEVWMLFGGYSDTKEMNRTVYISYDNGVHWSKAPEAMQLSDKVPYISGGDVIVQGHYLEADLSDAWAWEYSLSSKTHTRSDYTIDGTEIKWDCPFLYIFGGYTAYPDKTLNTYIYRGVLEKLRFTPSI